MFRMKKLDKVSIMEYVSVLWFIVSSGFFVLNYVYNIQCMLILLMLALYYVYVKRKISKKNAIRLMAFLGFVIVDELTTLAIYTYPIAITSLVILLIRVFALAIIMDNITVRNFMEKYINIFCVISVISLICFFIVQVTGITLPFAKSYMDGYFGTFYFRINEYTRNITTRNSGPYGEPGIFSIYIVLALIFQLFSSSTEDLKRKGTIIKIGILSITLLTTLSGTGLICFVIVIITYVITEIKNVNLLKNPILILVAILMIFGLYYAETTYGILEEKVIQQGGSYGVRLNDTIVGYEIAWKHFWFGTGIANDYSAAWQGVLLENSRSNGLANFGASVGIPFLAYYLVCVFRCAKVYMQGKKILTLALFVIIIVMFNTQPVVLQTIGLSFLFTWKKEERR